MPRCGTTGFGRLQLQQHGEDRERRDGRILTGGVNQTEIEADNTAPSSGAAYVFTRSGSVWTQSAYLKATNSGAGDIFGFGLSLSNDGSRLAVSARRGRQRPRRPGR